MVFTAPERGRWDLRLHTTDAGGVETASVSFVVSTAQVDLSGVWRGTDASRCRVRQEKDEVWWLCEPRGKGHPQLVGGNLLEPHPDALTRTVVSDRTA